jgi:hypothetical protein
MRMKRMHFLVGLLVVSLMIGAGCKKKAADERPVLEEDERALAPEPKDAMKEFEDANALSGGLRSVTYEKDGRTMRFSVPESWNGTGSVWKPDEASDINHVRITYFKNGAPVSEWKGQQGLDVHTVVQVEERENDYLLLVNHPALKATILKIFIPDQLDMERSYVLAECRIGYDADRPVLWDVCKTAIESLEIE